jgi:hypothetical protein
MRSGIRTNLVMLGATGLVTVTALGARSGSTVPTTSPTQARCRVQGVWDLVSRTIDGQDSPLNGGRERKIVTARHFMWVSHAGGRDTLPMTSELEMLRALKFEGGSGTYSITDSTYIERNELYDNAREIGTSFKATCRVTGDRWEHIFTIPNDTTTASGRILHFVQVYQRIG